MPKTTERCHSVHQKIISKCLQKTRPRGLLERFATQAYPMVLHKMMLPVARYREIKTCCLRALTLSRRLADLVCSSQLMESALWRSKGYLKLKRYKYYWSDEHLARHLLENKKRALKNRQTKSHKFSSPAGIKPSSSNEKKYFANLSGRSNLFTNVKKINNPIDLRGAGIFFR